jgi:flagellar assembly protein FliH
MSTSSSAAFVADTGPEVQPFRYADAPGNRPPGSAPGVPSAEDSNLQAEYARREQLAREEGQRDGESRARAFFGEQLDKLRGALAQTVADFAPERASYYERVESEVVQLALTIARKVLHREAQVDPLVLAGIVRVALDKMESGTKVSVKVAPQQVAEWRAFFESHMPPERVPEVIEDGSVSDDTCVLQTALGTTELGLEVQLREIEQGLADLMAQRPEIR